MSGVKYPLPGLGYIHILHWRHLVGLRLVASLTCLVPMYHISREKILELHYPSTQGGKLQENKQVGKRLQEVLVKLQRMNVLLTEQKTNKQNQPGLEPLTLLVHNRRIAAVSFNCYHVFGNTGQDPSAFHLSTTSWIVSWQKLGRFNW